MIVLALAIALVVLFPEPWAFALVCLVSVWIAGCAFQDWVDEL